MEKPNCLKCRHFFVTWNQKTPNGCRKFGIQCKDMPARVVAQAGGGECRAYTPKISRQDEKNSMDLNREDLW